MFFIVLKKLEGKYHWLVDQCIESIKLQDSVVILKIYWNQSIQEMQKKLIEKKFYIYAQEVKESPMEQ